MKSRIAGSVDQARRSAARVKSGGTPVAKKGRILDPGPSDSIVGKFVASKGGSVGGGCLNFSVASAWRCVASGSPLERMGGAISCV